jgi:monofunctional glycosyltransferase
VFRFLLLLLLLPAAFVAWLLAVWPPPIWYRSHWPSETAFMKLRHDEVPALKQSYHPVSLDSIAPAMAEAVTTGEDARFWTHHGIDFAELRAAIGYRRQAFDWSSKRDRTELLRAILQTWGKRDGIRGASTITQQLAKNLYLSPSRSPLRKVKEAVTAWRLEQALGKKRILELYLNVAELGPGIWGVDAASRRYYRRSARGLTQSQAAALAATLPFPLTSNPRYKPARMRRRQNLILRRMQGERVVVPKIEDEPVLQPGDTIQWTPGLDSLLDSLRAPVETLGVEGIKVQILDSER